MVSESFSRGAERPAWPRSHRRASDHHQRHCLWGCHSLLLHRSPEHRMRGRQCSGSSPGENNSVGPAVCRAGCIRFPRNHSPCTPSSRSAGSGGHFAPHSLSSRTRTFLQGFSRQPLSWGGQAPRAEFWERFAADPDPWFGTCAQRGWHWLCFL